MNSNGKEPQRGRLSLFRLVEWSDFGGEIYSVKLCASHAISACIKRLIIDNIFSCDL